MKDGWNRISFIKDVEMTDGKDDTIYLSLSNETEKCGGIEFWNDGTSVIIGHKKVVSKLKRFKPKIISIHYHNYRLALTILSFFKESTFLMEK